MEANVVSRLPLVWLLVPLAVSGLSLLVSLRPDDMIFTYAQVTTCASTVIALPAQVFVCKAGADPLFASAGLQVLQGACGMMFWFTRNRLCGSYFDLTAASRA